MTAAARTGADWGDGRAGAPDWEPPTGPTVFVVPHPDDEVLIMGGLLARQLETGGPVMVVAVTDGEAAYPDLDPEPLAAIRRREQHTALARLAGGPGGGLNTAPGSELARTVPPMLVRLGLPDGDVARFEPQLTAALRAATDGAPAPALVVAPWIHDHHADHEAVGRAAAVVATERSTVLAAGLFWGWSNTAPTPGLRRVAVSERHRHRRRTALAAHRSQLSPPPGTPAPPILTPTDLAPLAWRHEYYFVTTPRP